MFSFCRTVLESSKASLKDVGCGAAELYSVILRHVYNIYTPLIDRNEVDKIIESPLMLISVWFILYRTDEWIVEHNANTEPKTENTTK